jgi:two-component system response regulator PfeR
MNPKYLAVSHVLIIDQDPQAGARLCQKLSRARFQAQACLNGDEALACLRAATFDAVLIECPVPGPSGLQALRCLRQATSVPVMVMAGSNTEAERIALFRQGADDYLARPFSFEELCVRVEAILRRVALERGRRISPDTQAAGQLHFDERASDVWHGVQCAGLTPSEYRLLEALHRQREEVLSKPFLYQHVLQRDYARHDRSLDMHISQIRRKLKAIRYQGQQVRTVWGRGYVLTCAPGPDRPAA